MLFSILMFINCDAVQIAHTMAQSGNPLKFAWHIQRLNKVYVCVSVYVGVFMRLLSVVFYCMAHVLLHGLMRHCDYSPLV